MSDTEKAKIPEAAVEAAAEAIARGLRYKSAEWMAREALEAAAPHMVSHQRGAVGPIKVAEGNDAAMPAASQRSSALP